MSRWNVALVLLVGTAILSIVSLRLMRLCQLEAVDGPNYCSVQQTWDWLRAGGNWEMWTYLTVIAACGIAALIGSRKTV